MEPLEKFEYRDRIEGSDGMLAELPAKLAGAVDFDNLSLVERIANSANPAPRNSRRVTLWFRQGVKYVFHIHIVRKSGRCMIEMGGVDPTKVLKGIHVCKTHFDHWFKISPEEIKRFERKAQDDSRPVKK
jgi:hypothetical protein